MRPEERYREQLVIERIADRLGFATVGEKWLGLDIYPPYLYIGVALGFDYGVLNTYKHLTGGTHSLIADPFIILIPLGLFLAVVGLRYMRDGYADAIADLRIHDRLDRSDRSVFERMIAYRIKLIIYVFALMVFYLNLFFNLGFLNILSIEGIIPGIIANFFLIPLIYLPLLVEFMLAYFSIHFLLPRRISNADIGLFFYDPRNMGGLAPIGQLLKRSYYLFTGGLLLYLGVVYGSVVFSKFTANPYPKPGFVEMIFFSAAWFVGIVSIVYSMLKIHLFIVTEKEKCIRELEVEIREIINTPYDIRSSEVTDSEKLEGIQRRLEQIRNTKEYPTTLTMWSQMIISVLLPQILQIAMAMIT